MIRVVIADDQELVRDGIATLLELMEGIEAVALAANGEEAVRAVSLERPDVVLMDLRMPVRDGVSATEAIHAGYPDTRVLVLTTFGDDESVGRALAAGAAGYLTKDAGRRQLESAIRAVASGQWVLSPEVGLAVARGFAPAAGADRERRAAAIRTDWPALSAREAEVAERLVAGDSNTEIVERLVVSMATVKSHINAIFAKLGVADRGEAIALLGDPGRERP